MDCDTNAVVMDRSRPLSVDEWLRFLRDEVQLPVIAEQEIVKLAKNLTHRSNNINDFIQLNEQQLESDYQFDRQGLLNRIKRWQLSLHISKMPTQTSISTSTSSDHSDCSSKHNPLFSIVSFVMRKIDEHQVDSVLKCVADNSDDAVYKMVGTYRSIIKIPKMLCEQSVGNTETISIKCKICDEMYPLTKDLCFLVLLPVCFRCQERWLADFDKMYKASQHNGKNRNVH